MHDKPASDGEFAFITSTTVLMPGTRLTYHLQESSSRERVEEALYRDDDLVVARTDNGEADGEFPDVATRAELLDVARPHPNRLMTVVGGAERFRIDSAPSSEEGRIEGSSIEETSCEDRPSEVRAGDVLGLLQRLSDRGLEIAGAVRSELDEASPSHVADVVASIAFDDPEDHQALLENPDALERLDRVERQLDDLIETFASDA